MRRHARETIRRPKEFEEDFDWDSEERRMSKKTSVKNHEQPKDEQWSDFEEDEEEKDY